MLPEKRRTLSQGVFSSISGLQQLARPSSNRKLPLRAPTAAHMRLQSN